MGSACCVVPYKAPVKKFMYISVFFTHKATHKCAFTNIRPHAQLHALDITLRHTSMHQEKDTNVRHTYTQTCTHVAWWSASQNQLSFPALKHFLYAIL